MFINECTFAKPRRNLLTRKPATVDVHQLFRQSGVYLEQ